MHVYALKTYGTRFRGEDPKEKMKKAFTLIELLVVIAIIAILAAILFPVLAQARVAAKKTVAISSQKQISMSIIMYAGDNDDMYPRNDDCQPNSSLNTALNTRPFNPTGVGCTASPFFYRVNHYAWQKWVMPYVKNVDLFVHAGRGKLDTITSSCPGGQWSGCGQLTGSYMINLAVFGALNTYGNANGNGSVRNSWLGGSQGAVPAPAQGMVLLEMANPDISFAPTTWDIRNSRVQTHYPAAYREIWANELLKNGGTGSTNADVNPLRTFAGGMVLGFADGHAKFISAQQFLANTPTIAEYSPGVPIGYFTNGTYPNTSNDHTFNTNINYPMWMLGQ